MTVSLIMDSASQNPTETLKMFFSALCILGVFIEALQEFRLALENDDRFFF